MISYDIRNKTPTNMESNLVFDYLAFQQEDTFKRSMPDGDDNAGPALEDGVTGKGTSTVRGQIDFSPQATAHDWSTEDVYQA